MIRKYSIIVATSCDGGIGFENKIPWNIPEELSSFKRITSKTDDKDKNNAIIMGRKTWESLPVKPLPNRLNIIISGNPEYDIEANVPKSVIVVSSIEDAFMYCPTSNIENIFIIGGESIYKECFNNYKDYIDKVYLSIITNKNYKCDKFIDTEYIFNNFKVLPENISICDNYTSVVAYNNN